MYYITQVCNHCYFFIGHFADYFSTAVRTEKGISMLLIERSEGVETKLIKTSYSPSAGTAYVTFDNVCILMNEDYFHS